ncbi:hypothetical protein C8A01DRAFT_49041 [Parachaetomium inaequale]|uniref:Uncharacterized protein n=1 Tax=Parachaetomium inaequale TaxID=2588326 RepID=A0AAN6PA77_9PEZI|nr:hypothetical protein C8A01DRAFT_49041 [Parachaetomium inaequale]
MADPRKTPKRYFVVSSMDMHPSSVKVGSIISNLNHPDNPLSTFTPVIVEGDETTTATNKTTTTISISDNNELTADTCLTVTTADNTVGGFKRSDAWNLGIFATFLQQLIQAAKLSVSGSKASQFKFSAKEITTSRFAPSAKYIRAAVADEEVADFFRRNGRSARLYLIVAVKVARELTVARVEADKGGVDGVLGIDAATIDVTAGLKGGYKGESGFHHKEEYPGPVVFAFEVKQLRLRRNGEVERIDSDKIKGTMLGRPDGEDQEDGELDIVSDEGIDEDMLELFGIERAEGVGEEDGEACEVFTSTED